MSGIAIALILVAIGAPVLAAAAAAIAYHVGRRDGLEEKGWLDELPPVELGEQPLAPLDLSDTTDRLIHEARMENT